MKKISILIFGMALVLGLCACSSGVSQEELDEYTRRGEEMHKQLDEIMGEKPNYLADSFVPGLSDVLISVGIDPIDATGIEQIDDWVNGPRYSFSTHGTTARVYCNMDGSIESIRVGTDTDLYRRGYEPYLIDDFIVSEDMKSKLQICAEEAVTACLSYPSTADFPLMDWSFGRDHNFYSASSHVTAKNSFGVEIEIMFVAKFYDEGDTIRLIYLMLDGSAVLDDMDSVEIPERKQIEGGIEAPESNAEEIRLVDGQLGEYGESVKLDDWDYIWYHVPAGNYAVTCNSKTCSVYVDKDEITRNAEGYVEMENVETVEISYGEEKEVAIHEGEHIELTIYGDVTMTPIK